MIKDSFVILNIRAEKLSSSFSGFTVAKFITVKMIQEMIDIFKF